CIVTSLQIGIILTANYAFLNYLVLSLGFLLLDDRFLMRLLPSRWAAAISENFRQSPAHPLKEELVSLDLRAASVTTTAPEDSPAPPGSKTPSVPPIAIQMRELVSAAGLWLSGFFLSWILYANVFLILSRVFHDNPLPEKPVTVLKPFRVADHYGLFGRMTWKRYEIEFQGSN